MPRASDNRGTCHADEVFDGQRWLSQAPGHGDLLRSTSDVQVCPYVPAVAGLRSRDTYGYLCTFACTWHCTWICTPTAVPQATRQRPAGGRNGRSAGCHHDNPSHASATRALASASATC